MVLEKRVKEFQEAVKKDFGADLNFDDARKVLQGTVNYLVILEKIYLRIYNKNNDSLKNGLRKNH
jgi:hypothetical protein